MKNFFSLLLLSAMIPGTSIGKITPNAPYVGVSLGRPYLVNSKTQTPSNFSQISLGYRFTNTGSIYAFTPKISVQRSVYTTSQYFTKIGSDFQFVEAPNIYSNNRLRTYVAVFGLGLSVQRTLSKEFKLELQLEPQLGMNLVNQQLYTENSTSKSANITNNPIVFGGEITLAVKKKCNCGGTIMFGPGVILQNGAYIGSGNFRSVTPILSLGMLF